MVEGLQLVYAVGQKVRAVSDSGLERLEPLCVYVPDTTLADYEGTLPIIGPIDGDDHRVGLEASQHLFGIARLFRETEPEHVDGRAQVLHRETGRGPHRRCATVAADYEVGPNLERTLPRTCFDPYDSARRFDQARYLRRHQDLHGGKAPALIGQEIEKIPLRHQSHELAGR